MPRATYPFRFPSVTVRSDICSLTNGIFPCKSDKLVGELFGTSDTASNKESDGFLTEASSLSRYYQKKRFLPSNAERVLKWVNNAEKRKYLIRQLEKRNIYRSSSDIYRRLAPCLSDCPSPDWDTIVDGIELAELRKEKGRLMFWLTIFAFCDQMALELTQQEKPWVDSATPEEKEQILLRKAVRLFEMRQYKEVIALTEPRKENRSMRLLFAKACQGQGKCLEEQMPGTGSFLLTQAETILRELSVTAESVEEEISAREALVSLYDFRLTHTQFSQEDGENFYLKPMREEKAILQGMKGE